MREQGGFEQRPITRQLSRKLSISQTSPIRLVIATPTSPVVAEAIGGRESIDAPRRIGGFAFDFLLTVSAGRQVELIGLLRGLRRVLPGDRPAR